VFKPDKANASDTDAVYQFWLERFREHLRQYFWGNLIVHQNTAINNSSDDRDSHASAFTTVTTPVSLHEPHRLLSNAAHQFAGMCLQFSNTHFCHY
jgi:hypothetical protein